MHRTYGPHRTMPRRALLSATSDQIQAFTLFATFELGESRKHTVAVTGEFPFGMPFAEVHDDMLSYACTVTRADLGDDAAGMLLHADSGPMEGTFNDILRERG